MPSCSNKRGLLAVAIGMAFAVTPLPLHAKPVTPVAITKAFDQGSGTQRAAANAIVNGSSGDISLEQIKAGKTRLFSWFGRRSSDVLFLVTTRPLDYPQACFAMALEDGTFQHAGCVNVSLGTLYRQDRGPTKIPWLRVKLDTRTVSYCWDGARYDLLADHPKDKGCV